MKSPIEWLEYGQQHALEADQVIRLAVQEAVNEACMQECTYCERGDLMRASDTFYHSSGNICDARRIRNHFKEKGY